MKKTKKVMTTDSYKIICGECGTMFESKYSTAKYCSQECKDKRAARSRAEYHKRYLENKRLKTILNKDEAVKAFAKDDKESELKNQDKCYLNLAPIVAIKSCRFCGKPIERVAIKALSNNNEFIIDQDSTCCAVCDAMKGSLSDEEFIASCEMITRSNPAKHRFTLRKRFGIF